MTSGYYVTAYCTRESPDEPAVYDILESIQRAIALNQKSLASLQRKLDNVLAERKRPYVERGYRS